MIDIDQAFAPIDEDDLAHEQPASPGDTWRPLLPVPADAPKPTNEILKRAAPPSHTFTTG